MREGHREEVEGEVIVRASSCRECLEMSIIYSPDAEVKCPFMDNEYECNFLMAERDIKQVCLSVHTVFHILREFPCYIIFTSLSRYENYTHKIVFPSDTNIHVE